MDVIGSCAECQRILLEADESFGKRSPFNSIYKMKAVVDKAGNDHGNLIWLTGSVVYAVKSQLCSSGEMTVAGLTGQGRNGRGFLDIALFKKELRPPKSTGFGACSAVQCAMQSETCLLKRAYETPRLVHLMGRGTIPQDKVNSHVAFMDAIKDRSWIGVLPSPAKAIVNLIEAQP
jgi:hypothetical protein